MDDLKAKGTEKTRAIYTRHGMPGERAYGVSNADLKVIAKSIKGQQDLACELYATGNLDAMYLAGIVVNGAKMTKDQLHAWAEGAAGMSMISEYTVPWAALDHPDAREIAVEWIASPKEHVAAAGWCTYTGLLATHPDSALDLAEIEGLLALSVKEISCAPNRVKGTMNGFVIAVGTYVQPLLAAAKETANKIGVVSMDMGDTACQIRLASESIAKVEAANKIGQKRKTMRC